MRDGKNLRVEPHRKLSFKKCERSLFEKMVACPASSRLSPAITEAASVIVPHGLALSASDIRVFAPLSSALSCLCRAGAPRAWERMILEVEVLVFSRGSAGNPRGGRK